MGSSARGHGAALLRAHCLPGPGRQSGSARLPGFFQVSPLESLFPSRATWAQELESGRVSKAGGGGAPAILLLCEKLKESVWSQGPVDLGLSIPSHGGKSEAWKGGCSAQIVMPWLLGAQLGRFPAFCLLPHPSLFLTLFHAGGACSLTVGSRGSNF